MNSPTDNAGSDDAKKSGRAELLALLKAGVALAEDMNRAVENMFPEAAKAVREKGTPDYRAMSVDEKIKLGDKAIRSMHEIGFQRAPERAIDAIEATLTTDAPSLEKTQELMRRLSTGKN